MKNLEIAQIFYEIANILEMKGIEFKPVAYRRAAKSIESLQRDIEEIYKEDKLEEISGVGKSIARKITEIIETGKLRALEKLKKQVPAEELMEISEIGPKTAKLLYEKLKIKNIKDLRKSIKKHKIAKLKGMGLKSEEDILKGIQLYKKGQERMLLGQVLPIAEEIADYLRKSKLFEKVDLAGSLRRMRETIKDIDILACSSFPEKAMNYFVKFPSVKRVLAKGHTKTSVILDNKLQVDIRVVEKDSYGSALQYFTGSKEHSIALRKIAIKKGLKMSEYGVFKKKTNKKIAGKTERETYKAIGFPYIEPELRENRGEIEAKKLPSLVKYSDIKGDLHIHSEYSDGADSIKAIAEKARSLGYQYICITDHSKSQKIAGGLEIKDLEKQIKEIRKIKNFKVFTGTEVDIRSDGSLDYPDYILKKLDIVIAAVHSGFKFSREKMTSRIIKAMQNEHVDILAHPTGRLINRREPYNVDLNRLFKTAVETKTILEINALPERLDLNDNLIKLALEKGVKFAIGTDAHNIDQLNLMKFGVATARRGWASKKHIVNALSLKEIKNVFK